LEEFREYLRWKTGDAILAAEANVAPDQILNYFGDHGQRMTMVINFFVNPHLFLAVAERQEAFPEIARHSGEQCSMGFQPVSGFGVETGLNPNDPFGARTIQTALIFPPFTADPNPDQADRLVQGEAKGSGATAAPRGSRATQDSDASSAMAITHGAVVPGTPSNSKIKLN
jgi:hypothetical protein